MRPRALVRSAFGLFLALTAVACLDTVAPGLDAPHSVAAILVQPASAHVSLGKPFSFAAKVTDQSGAPITGEQVTWRSSDTSVALVDTSGNITTRKLGTAQITASTASVSGSATLTVDPVAVAAVDLSPSSATIGVGDTIRLSATPRDDQGNALTGRTVSWSSSNNGVATVAASGVVTGVATGTVQITATVDGVSATSTIKVGPAPIATITVSPDSVAILPQQSAQFTATLRDAQGNVLTGPSVTWTSSDTTVATISASGMVTGIDTGTVTVTASSQNKNGKGHVHVSHFTVGSVTVSPTSNTIKKGGSTQLNATVMDQNGHVLKGQIVSWSTSNANVAPVSSSGDVTGLAEGSATITASSGGQSGTAGVQVVASTPSVSSVSVTPSPDTIVIGASTQLTATPKDSTGGALTGYTITWSSSSSSIATVSSTGQVSGVAAGTATISATTSGQTGTATVVVQQAPVASVVITPSSASIAVAGTVQLSAATYDANGQPLTGRTITWSTSSSAIATVSSSGLVKGVALGSATIYATSEGQKDSATITVTQAPVATVTVSPSSASLAVGKTQQLSVTLKDASGNVLTGRTVTWTTSSSSVATTSSSGLVTAVAAGTATITATSEGKTGKSTITVQAPVATVTLSPASASLQTGSTQQFTATLKDASGNVLTGRTITWASSNTGAVTVSGSGLATAVAAGSATITATSEGKSGTASVSVTAPPTGTHTGWYVSPSGSSGGSGSASSPWSLATALSGGNGKVQPGDTIWLRGGTYPAQGSGLTSTLTGTASAPIIVRQYPGERATVDGSILINGSYTWYWGFEVANTNTTTQDVIGVSVAGPNNKFIDMVSHDHSGNGFFLAESAPNTEVYGSIIYNNGFHGSTSTSHGHGIYLQNVSGYKLVADNILFNQFGYNLHAYGDAGHLVNITFDGNVAFNAGAASAKGDQPNMLVGGSQPVTNLVVQNNLTWDQANSSTSVWFGYQPNQSNSATIKNNYFVGGAPTLEVDDFTSFSFTGNTVMGTGQSGSLVYEVGGAGGFAWSGNTYYGNSAATEWAWNGAGYTFSGWRSATGLGSNDVHDGAQPSGQKIAVEPNQYEPGRANVVVYNWSGASTASVDLSSVLHVGDSYVVRNAQNFYGTPVASGTYGGGTIQIPLAAVTPPTPITGWQNGVPGTGTRFLVFVVMRPGS